MRVLLRVAILVGAVSNIAALQSAWARDAADPCARSQASAVDETMDADMLMAPMMGPFFNAVLNQDIERVRRYLAEGFDPRRSDEYGNTALHWAAVLDNKPIVDLLIRCGADLDAPAALTGATPLLMAVDHEAISATTSLLSAGAHVGSTVSLKENNSEIVLTVVDIAARRNRADLVFTLVEHGAEVASSTSHALRYAIANKNVNLAQFLLDRGARHPNMNASASPSFLHDALWLGDNALAETLILHGARTADLTTSLSKAAAHANDRVFELMLRLGPDLNRHDERGETPLMAAARAGRLAAVEQLLAAGAPAADACTTSAVV